MKNRNLVLAAGVFLFAITVGMGMAYATDDGHGNDSSESSSGLQPFTSSDVRDPSICKYIFGSQQTAHTDLPPLFKNVHSIYIQGTSNFYHPKERSLAVFRPDNIAALAACTVSKDTGGHIPLFVPQVRKSRWQSLPEWPSATKAGNLIIRVSVTRQDERSFHHKLSPGDIVIANVAFYRSDLNDPSVLNHTCASAFQYTEDKDKLGVFLTDALHICLDVPFNWTSD